MATSLPLDRLSAGFNRLPLQNRVGLMVAVAALAAVLAAAWLYSRSPDWRILFANVNDRDGGAIVAALGQMNVPYRFNESGTVILVPDTHVHDARLKLAAQGLPRGGTVGFELIESQKLGATQFQQQIAYQRALEGELARTIGALAAVHSARVHLAVPKPTTFLREQARPTASVMIALYPGKTLERAQVAGIVNLVASSVPQLSPRSVSVVDEAGTLLSTPQDGPATGLDAGQLAYVQSIEAATIRRIRDILEPIVGGDSVRAQVTAEIDFSSSEATAESYKPNPGNEAAVRSLQSSESAAPGAAGAQGVPGPASNQPTGEAAVATPGGARPAGAAPLRKDTNTRYELDRTVRRTHQPTGQVKRLSAAVVVNHRIATDAKGKVTETPRSEEEMKQIQALVKEAMGFSQTRGDSLNIANAAFRADPAPAPVAEPPLWKQPETVAFARELGKNLLIAALVLYAVFGILKPLAQRLTTLPQVEPVDAGALLAHGGATQAERLAATRQLARQDPKVVASVVKSWVGGNE